MPQILSQQEFDELMVIKGKIRGVTLKTMGEYLLQEEGEIGVGLMEKEIERLGYDFKFSEIETMDFYPLGLQAVILILMKRMLNYGNGKFQEVGRANAKFSLIIRLFMKYFFSVRAMVDKVPKLWEKHYTVGKLEVVDYDEEENYIILKLSNFKLHPFHCEDLKGYFSVVSQMIVGKEVSCEEKRCVHRGDNYHEFLLEW